MGDRNGRTYVSLSTYYAKSDSLIYSLNRRSPMCAWHIEMHEIADEAFFLVDQPQDGQLRLSQRVLRAAEDLPLDDLFLAQLLQTVYSASDEG